MAQVMTNLGIAEVTNALIGGELEIGTSYLGWGTGAGTAAKTDTTLFTESPQEARTAMTLSRQTTNVTNDTLRAVGTLTCQSAGKTITNAGVFTYFSSKLIGKVDHTGIALNVGESIEYTFNFVF